MTFVELDEVIWYMERYAQTHTDSDILLIDVANGLLEHFIEKEGEKMTSMAPQTTLPLFDRKGKFIAELVSIKRDKDSAYSIGEIIILDNEFVKDFIDLPKEGEK